MMKKFLCKIILMALAVVAFNALTLFGIPKDGNEYVCAYNQKVRLLETTEQPRIIFIGGSNLAFSMNSKTISDSLGLNVVNFGLHAGIGARYPAEDALAYIKRGDIVVMQFEYSNFFSGGNGEPETFALLMISTNWRNAEELNVQQWKAVLAGLPLVTYRNLRRLAQYPFTRSFNSPETGIKFPYVASGFNEYGDEVSHFNYADIPFHPSGKIEERDVDRDFIGWLEEMTARYEQAGAKVIMLPPVCLTSALPSSYNDNISIALENIGHPYLVPPTSMALDDSCMFNTAYHMNRAGCEQNTQNIIRSLRFIAVR